MSKTTTTKKRRVCGLWGWLQREYGMKALVTGLLLFLSSDVLGEIPSGSYNGYFHLENRIRTKMMRSQDRSHWTLISHLNGVVFPPSSDQIEGLLGMYNNGVYQNGLPNALNWTLYNLLFSRFAADYSETCTPYLASSEFQHSAVEIARSICEQAKNSGQILEETLLDLWLLTMGYDARFRAFEDWSRFANSEELRVLPPRQRLALLTKVVFLNPYSLIRD